MAGTRRKMRALEAGTCTTIPAAHDRLAQMYGLTDNANANVSRPRPPPGPSARSGPRPASERSRVGPKGLVARPREDGAASLQPGAARRLRGARSGTPTQARRCLVLAPSSSPRRPGNAAPPLPVFPPARLAPRARPRGGPLGRHEREIACAARRGRSPLCGGGGAASCLTMLRPEVCCRRRRECQAPPPPPAPPPSPSAVAPPDKQWPPARTRAGDGRVGPPI